LNRFFRSALFPLIILVVLAWVAMNTLTGNDKQAEKATYSDLVARVQDNPESIEQVTVNPRKQEITADLTGADKRKIVVNYPTDESYTFFERQLRAEGVKYDSKGVGGNWWGSILVSLLPFGAGVHGVTTEGLAYPLADEPLPPGPARGLSNVRAVPDAAVSVRAGRLLVIETPATLVR